LSPPAPRKALQRHEFPNVGAGLLWVHPCQARASFFLPASFGFAGTARRARPTVRGKVRGRAGCGERVPPCGGASERSPHPSAVHGAFHDAPRRPPAIAAYLRNLVSPAFEREARRPRKLLSVHEAMRHCLGTKCCIRVCVRKAGREESSILSTVPCRTIAPHERLLLSRFHR